MDARTWPFKTGVAGTLTAAHISGCKALATSPTRSPTPGLELRIGINSGPLEAGVITRNASSTTSGATP
jgi:hypothetical protein